MVVRHLPRAATTDHSLTRRYGPVLPGPELTRAMDAGGGLTLVVVADIAAEALNAFQAYELHVLALLPRHGGRVERRLRSADGTSEVHVLSFRSRAGYEDYLGDPDRARHRSLLEGAEVTQRLLEVTDV